MAPMAMLPHWTYKQLTHGFNQNPAKTLRTRLSVKRGLSGALVRRSRALKVL